MKMIRVIALVATAIMINGCAGLLTKAEEANTKVVEFTLDRGINYCDTFPEDTRMENRAATDLGLGPIIEVHCERIPVN